MNKEKRPKDFIESKTIAKQGGIITGNARKEIEEKTGKKVITAKNAEQLK